MSQSAPLATRSDAAVAATVHPHPQGQPRPYCCVHSTDITLGVFVLIFGIGATICAYCATQYPNAKKLYNNIAIGLGSAAGAVLGAKICRAISRCWNHHQDVVIPPPQRTPADPVTFPRTEPVTSSTSSSSASVSVATSAVDASASRPALVVDSGSLVNGTAAIVEGARQTVGAPSAPTHEEIQTLVQSIKGTAAAERGKFTTQISELSSVDRRKTLSLLSGGERHLLSFSLLDQAQNKIQPRLDSSIVSDIFSLPLTEAELLRLASRLDKEYLALAWRGYQERGGGEAPTQNFIDAFGVLEPAIREAVAALVAPPPPKPVTVEPQPVPVPVMNVSGAPVAAVVRPSTSAKKVETAEEAYARLKELGEADLVSYLSFIADMDEEHQFAILGLIPSTGRDVACKGAFAAAIVVQAVEENPNDLMDNALVAHRCLESTGYVDGGVIAWLRGSGGLSKQQFADIVKSLKANKETEGRGTWLEQELKKPIVVGPVVRADASGDRKEASNRRVRPIRPAKRK